MNASEFLGRLFGDAVGVEHEVVVWAKGLSTRWCSTVRAAVDATQELDPKADTYFGVTLQSWLARSTLLVDGKPPSPSSSRSTALTATALGGLWVDVDYDNGVHAKRNLPPSLAAALELVHGLPAKPTLVLETGGGVHAWWLFREPWLITDQVERVRAAGVSHAWQRLVARVAKSRGWSLDMTHDLARVLRLPGTRNHKYGDRVVEVVHDDPHATYNPSDFEVWVSPGDLDVSVGLPDSTAEQVVGGIRLAPDAEPPFDKLFTMLELDATFERTWKHKRKGFPSQSEYDMALGAALVEAGWTDQEIVNTLIAHRRQGGSPPKLRADYYRGLLAKVRSTRRSGEAQQRLAESDAIAEERSTWNIENPATPAVTADAAPAAERSNGHAKPSKPQPYTEQDQARELSDVSAALGVEVLALVKTLGEPAAFRLKLRAADLRTGELLPFEVDLGDVEGVLTFRRFRSALASVCSHVLDPIKPARWGPIARALLRTAEVQDIGQYSTNALTVREWLKTYVSHRGIAQTVEDGVGGRMPFMAALDRGGQVRRPHVRLADLQRWLKIEGEVPTSKVLARWMRQAGCAPHVVSIKRDEDWSTVHAWLLPSDLPLWSTDGSAAGHGEQGGDADDVFGASL